MSDGAGMKAEQLAQFAADERRDAKKRADEFIFEWFRRNATSVSIGQVNSFALDMCGMIENGMFEAYRLGVEAGKQESGGNNG